jgi:hypothetical protein
MKLHIWITDEPLSDDADGDQKIYADYTCVIGNNLHEARGLPFSLGSWIQLEIAKASQAGHPKCARCGCQLGPYWTDLPRDGNNRPLCEACNRLQPASEPRVLPPLPPRPERGYEIDPFPSVGTSEEVR